MWFIRTGSDHLTTINATHVHVHSNYGNGIISVDQSNLSYQ